MSSSRKKIFLTPNGLYKCINKGCMKVTPTLILTLTLTPIFIRNIIMNKIMMNRVIIIVVILYFEIYVSIGHVVRRRLMIGMTFKSFQHVLKVFISRKQFDKWIDKFELIIYTLRIIIIKIIILKLIEIYSNFIFEI